MFDNIFAAIEKWMRELLTGMVESNMSTMFTDVNEKTSEIAAQVGRTPQNWNSSVFSMIQNLSESVVVPIAGIIITLVLCYKAEILDEDEYSQLKEHYIAEKQRLEHELQKQRQRALELEKRIKICDAQMERMRGILNQNEFDEELVHELIKRIYVGMDNSVEVEFKCSDPYQEVLAIMSEVQNE